MIPSRPAISGVCSRYYINACDPVAHQNHFDRFEARRRVYRNETKLPLSRQKWHLRGTEIGRSTPATVKSLPGSTIKRLRILL
jgi:hypothetical protein